MLTEDFKYIGVDLPDKHKFENQYTTPHGMSYNSYVILGEKVAILDTVDSDATEFWLHNLKEALGSRQPDYLIAHHMEPDHSSNIQVVMDMFPNMRLVASAKALAMVEQFFEAVDYSDRIITVADGDTIDLGNRQLRVLTAPFVHWPEVIMTYDPKDKILFSADAFGRFGALQYEQTWLPEARRYYCNIVGKYGTQVQTVLKKVAALDIDTIAPLHGPVLQNDLSPYIDAYQHWSTYTPESDGVLVAYASVYGGTARAALYAADELRQRGVEVVTCDLCNCDMSEAVAQAFRMGRMLLASITYDAGLFTPMYEFLHRLSIKNLQRRKVALIENGTWAPIAARQMTEMLGKMKDMEIVTPTLSIRSTMHAKDLPTLESLLAAL